MKIKVRFLSCFVTSFAVFCAYIFLAVLICSLAGCNTEPQENIPSVDSQIPLTPQVPVESQMPAITTPEPLQLPVRENPLAVGFQDYYVVRADGMLMVWGSQEFGGFGEEVPFSVAAELLPNTAAVYTNGRGATLAVDRNGGLWAINTAQFNEIVSGVRVDMEKNPMEPVKVMDGVAMVAMNQFHSLILKQNGTLWVNGLGSFGAPWLNKTGNYLIEVMDNVIWTDITSCGGYAVTANHELWGWGLNQNSSGPEKLMENVVQVSNLNMALTETGELLHWDVDYETGAIIQPSIVLQDINYCGHDFAIKTDRTLWISGAGWSSATVQSEEPFRQVMEKVSSATQGERSMLVILQNGSLWELSYAESTDGLIKTQLGEGFYVPPP